MNLKEYLEKKDMGLREFSRDSGVSPATISRILSGERSMTLVIAYRIFIAGSPDINMEDLITLVERQHIELEIKGRKGE